MEKWHLLRVLAPMKGPCANQRNHFHPNKSSVGTCIIFSFCFCIHKECLKLDIQQFKLIVTQTCRRWFTKGPWGQTIILIGDPTAIGPNTSDQLCIQFSLAGGHLSLLTSIQKREKTTCQSWTRWRVLDLIIFAAGWRQCPHNSCANQAVPSAA